MSKEAVMKVKEAEAEAQKIVSDAIEQGKLAVARAEEEAERSCEEYELKITEEYDRSVELVKTDAAKIVEKNKIATDSEMQTLEEQARLRMSDAVRIVIKGIVSECQ